MSMSTHAMGYIPADDVWNKMKCIWEACDVGGIDIPDEVYDFFKGNCPKDKPGMEIPLGDSCSKYTGDMAEGYEIDISKLPQGVQFIRVYNSY